MTSLQYENSHAPNASCRTGGCRSNRPGRGGGPKRLRRRAETWRVGSKMEAMCPKTACSTGRLVHSLQSKMVFYRVHVHVTMMVGRVHLKQVIRFSGNIWRGPKRVHTHPQDKKNLAANLKVGQLERCKDQQSQDRVPNERRKSGCPCHPRRMGLRATQLPCDSWEFGFLYAMGGPNMGSFHASFHGATHASSNPRVVQPTRRSAAARGLMVTKDPTNPTTYT